MNRSIILIISLLILLSACEIKPFAIPSWDVDIRIPLIHQRFYVSDLADDVNLIIGDEDVLTLVANGEMETPAMGNIELNPDFDESNIPIISGVPMNMNFPFSGGVIGTTLYYGNVAEGRMKVRFADIYPGAELSLSITGIYNGDGSPLVMDSDGTGDWQYFDLSGCRLGSPTDDEEFDNISITVYSQSDAPPGTTLANLSIQINEPLSFSGFKGALDGFVVPIMQNASVLQLEYPSNIDQAITPQEAMLVLDVTNEIGFRCEFEGVFKAIGANETRTIPIKDNNGNNFIIEAATEDGPTTTQLVFSEGLSALLQVMPTEIIMESAQFIISAYMGSGTLKSTDILHGAYRVSAPLKFTLHEHPIVVDEAVKIEISEDNQELIRDRLDSAALEFTVTNKLPIGAKAEIFFGYTPNIDPDNPNSYIFKKEVTLRANDNASNILSLGLNSAELSAFTRDEVYLKWRFSFEESGEVITITAGLEDYVEIRSMITARIIIGEV